jgi:hypothetical protein
VGATDAEAGGATDAEAVAVGTTGGVGSGVGAVPQPKSRVRTSAARGVFMRVAAC